MYAVYAVKGGKRKTVYNDSWLTVGEYVQGAVAANPVLTLEDNQAGSFQITLPSTNNGYDFVERFTTEFVVYKLKRNKTGEALTETEIFRGRVIGEQVDMDGNRVLSAEGELNYLCDTRQPGKKYARTMSPSAYFKALLDVHNSKVDKSRKFKMGTCEFMDWSEDVQEQIAQKDEENDDYKYRETSYEDTLTCIADAFNDLDNPHLSVRKSGNDRYLDFLADARDGGSWGASVVSNQEVRLGVNLLSISKEYDMSNIFSVMIPIGAAKESEQRHVGAPISGNERVVSGYSGTVIGYSGIEGVDDPNYKVYGPWGVTPGHKYFYSGVMQGNYGMAVFFTQEGDIMGNAGDYGFWGNGGKKMLIEEVFEVPEGAHQLYIAGYGDEVPLRLNDYTEEETNADQNVNVRDIVDNKRGKKKGTVYVKNDELLKKYGWLEKIVEFPNVKTPQILYNKAIKYFETDVFEQLSFEVTTVDLSYVDPEKTPYEVGKSIMVYANDEELKNGKLFPISKLEIHLDAPQNNNVTMGYKRHLTMTGNVQANSANLKKSVAELHKEASNAVRTATDLIRNGMNGYVTFVRDPEDEKVIRELVISNTPDYKAATQIWRWNMGGLGFASVAPGHSAYDEGDFELAMTMDGTINANFIKTGTMSAERIFGGTLTVGIVEDNDDHTGVAGAKLITYALIPQGDGTYAPMIVSALDQDGFRTYSYDYANWRFKTVRMVDAEIRGFFRSGPNPADPNVQSHKTGTLNLARDEDWGASLRAEYSNLQLTAAGDVTLRGNNIYFELYDYATDSYKKELIIDSLGLHPANGHRDEGSATGSFRTADGQSIWFQNGLIYKAE